MKILCISGSARPGSANQNLLLKLDDLCPEHEFRIFDISQLPLFTDNPDRKITPAIVDQWRSTIVQAQALIISTPEYIHNIPAALKNSLEWVYATGELAGKKVLPIVFTPRPPRGEKAMKSLVFSLLALEAHIVAGLNLYQEDWQDEETRKESIEMLTAAVGLF